MEHRSRLDPNRKTVGAIYNEVQMASHDPYVIAGDLSHELTKSLVDDLNATIQSNPYDGKPFYIVIHEHKDLTMPRAIRRDIHTMRYRPYPEDDTVVFWVNPKTTEVLFCWSLEHYSQINNVLRNEILYDAETVNLYKAWKAHALEHFGFMKDEKGNWIPNPRYKDKPLEKQGPKILIPAM